MVWLLSGLRTPPFLAGSPLPPHLRCLLCSCPCPFHTSPGLPQIPFMPSSGMWPRSCWCFGSPNLSSGWKMKEVDSFLCASPFFPGSPVRCRKAAGVTNPRCMCPQGKSGNSFKRAPGDLVRPLCHCCLVRLSSPCLATVSASSESPLFSKDQVLCAEEKGLVLSLLTSEPFWKVSPSSGRKVWEEKVMISESSASPHISTEALLTSSKPVMVLKSSNEILCWWGRKKDEVVS